MSTDPNWLGTSHPAGTMTTYTGKAVTPLDLQPEHIDIIDIAHSLSRINRYNGHTAGTISVAAHSVAVSDKLMRLDPQLALWGLLHDASEAYLGDIIRPLKVTPAFSFYKEAEERAMKVIADKYYLDWPMPDEVIQADNNQLREELEFLRGDPGVQVSPLSAKTAFLERFLELSQ